MNLKVRLLVIPSLLAAGLLGACGPQEADQNVPAEPGVIQDEAGVIEPEVGEPGEIDVVEGEATTVAPAEEVTEGEATTVAPAEEVTEGEATTVAPAEEVTEGEATTVAPAEEVTEGEATTVAPAEEMAETEGLPGMDTLDMTSAVKASEIIGYDVENMAGEDLGDIEDLLVDVSSGQVRYAILSFGGFLNIGDKLFAIPLNATNFNAEEQAFIFDVTEERLENAPAFERDNWPDFADPEWDMSYNDYWQNAGDEQAATEDAAATQEQAQGEGTTQEGTVTEDQAAVQGDATLQDPEQIAGGHVIRASELMDYNIHNAQNEEVGEVEDLIVPMNNQTQQLAYAVLSLDELDDTTAMDGDTTVTEDDSTVVEGDTATEGTTVEGDVVAGDTLEERLYAIPVNQLTLTNPEDEFFVFNADPQMLDTALSFSQDEWSQLMNLEDVN